jgi:hypothetical protein
MLALHMKSDENAKHQEGDHHEPAEHKRMGTRAAVVLVVWGENMSYCAGRWRVSQTARAENIKANKYIHQIIHCILCIT